MSLGLLTSLLLVGMVSAQCAKPAELPIDPNVTCTAEEAEAVKDILVTVEETRTAGLLFGVDGANTNAGLSAGIGAVEQPETLDVMPTETEETEPEVCQQAEPLPCGKAKPVEAEVAELLEACQRAVADGNRDEAQSLIYQAMLLDPAGIAVNALAERVREMSGKSARPNDEESKEEPCEDPSGADPIDPEDTLQPSLPPVDPGIVNALEKVLRESSDAVSSK